MSRILVRSESPEQARAILKEMFKRGGQWAGLERDSVEATIIDSLNFKAFVLIDNRIIKRSRNIKASLGKPNTVEEKFSDFILESTIRELKKIVL